ncbi:hypothetical protein [Cohnella herbarum]|uniref:Uncharacterized protein n=1 Tax=Cohnella herbarum TaxID=2728023 RepID=A0A7Z2VLR1_9BACL|nr:hypothetical protein [Cohnella herbarum]QJD85125.1 hypothetical protein HH215_19410 [Cohnella herbarum]
MGLAGRPFYNYFLYNSKPLPYNRLPYSNCSERTIEIPLALHLLRQSGAGSGESFLEVGNVLANYQELLAPYPVLSNRIIIDKYEDSAAVLNLDFMEYDTKHSLILCLSTAAHYMKHGKGENSSVDRETPLKAIRHIYNLLKPNGVAWITLPYGQLMDCDWLIQFSDEYLRLLSDAYGVPPDAIDVEYFRRQDMALQMNTPLQSWIQCDKEDLTDALYDSPFPFSNGIAVVRLRKIGNDVTADPKQHEPLYFRPAPIISSLYFAPFIRPAGFDKDGFLAAGHPGYVFYGHHLTLSSRSYLLHTSIEIEGSGEFTLELTSGKGLNLLWNQTVSGKTELHSRIELDQDALDAEIRLYKHNTSECRIRVPFLRLTVA